MSTIHGVVFDLDGVLFDSEPIHRLAWMRSMGELGHDIDEPSLMPWTGIPCRLLAEHYSRSLEPRRPSSVYESGKTRAFRRLASERLRPFDRVPELLDALSARVRLAFATSNTRDDAELMMSATGLKRHFAGGVTYDDVEHHKPAPDPYLAAARLLSLPPTRCVAIEDSEAGIESSSAAGMTVLAVATSHGPDRLSGADHVFERTTDAVEWILLRIAPSDCCRK